LSDPEGFTLARYCGEHDHPYDGFGFPIPLQTFARYGAAFQQRLVPQVEPKTVERVDLPPGGFVLRLEGGAIMRATSVLMAVGLTYFRSLPGLPRRLAGVRRVPRRRP
jgi:hypothetical protein